MCSDGNLFSSGNRLGRYCFGDCATASFEFSSPVGRANSGGSVGNNGQRVKETIMTFDPRTEYQDLETAERYDQKRFNSISGKLFQWSEKRVLQRIVSKMPPGSLVLDAPCGTGRLLPLYLAEGLRILGVDISGEMIQVARRRTAKWNGRTNFSRMDFIQIPLTNGSVD